MEPTKKYFLKAAERFGAGLIVTSPPGRSGEQRFLRQLEESGSVVLGGAAEAAAAAAESVADRAASFSWNDAYLPSW